MVKTEKGGPLLDQIRELKERQVQTESEIEKLKKANSFLRALFEEIDEEIMVIDPSFVINDVNKVFLKRYGLKKEEVVGRKCHEITYNTDKPCDFGKQICPLIHAKKTGKRVETTHLVEHKGVDSKEIVRVIYPVDHMKQGFNYFIEISRDVTEYRTLIKDLKASEKRFKSILDTATDAILSIDGDHKIVLFNDAAERIFGYRRKEILGKDLKILIPLQYGDHYKHVRRFLDTKEPRVMGESLSLTALRRGGQEFPIELGLSYHELEKEITFTAIIRDLTHQKKMEKNLLQSERLAAVGQTVAHVAHEIKNPLMIIGGFADQIRKSLTDNRAIQKLDLIFEEVGRLDKLVSNLGDFTKEYRLMKRSTDINSVIRDVLKIMTEIYPSEKYLFVADLPDNLKEVHCDPDKMKQVFINVIVNGVEAMDEGGTVRISTREQFDGLEIKISDEGRGIPEGNLLSIFEPFYTTRERGCGLGLSISYKIVEAHNGEISAVSLPGEGTSFFIKLPCE
ncbi:MAG: PAS domain S-box protein [Desulfatiglans sp.]|jgi:two-component system sensor kinase FixL|nr:PAS domain S-box protein [Desulfatiglans sp.]